MRKVSLLKLENIHGGLCINRPGEGQENSGVYCPGYCLATQIVNASGGNGFDFICFA